MIVNQTALPPRTRIGHYCIEKVIGAGGFGITYKAKDLLLKCDVAIKEFFPSDIAIRVSDGPEIIPVSSDQANQYKHGLKRFLEEARTLAHFKLQTIIRVHTFLKKHGTAYIVMDYENGLPLHTYLKSCHTLSEKETYCILKPLMKGLKEVHDAGILHRDIKPPNIYLRKRGVPVLLDFGSARHAFGNRNVTNMVTPGYAPFEQYNSRDEQGPWTDLYSLGATLYRCITGVSPTNSLDRLAGLQNDGIDPLQSVSTVASGRINSNLLEIIDWMLSIQISDRPQNVAEVLKQLSTSVTDNNQYKVVHTYHAKQWDDSLLENIKQELTRYLGPIANLVVDDAKNTALNMKQLCRLLANEIDSKLQRELFLRNTAHYILSQPDVPLTNSRPATGYNNIRSLINVLEPEKLKRAEEELAKYMGPLAPTLVRQAADESGCLDDFINILTDDIPTEREREEFTISIRASIAS